MTKLITELFNDQKPYSNEKQLVNTIRNKKNELIDDLIEYYTKYQDKQDTTGKEKERVLYEVLKSYPSLRTRNKVLSFIYKNLVQRYSRRREIKMPSSSKSIPAHIIFGQQNSKQVQQFKSIFTRFIDKWRGRPTQQETSSEEHITFTSKGNILTFTVNDHKLMINLNNDKVTLNCANSTIRDKAIAYLDDTDYGLLRTFFDGKWKDLDKIDPPCTKQVDKYTFSDCIQKSEVSPKRLKKMVSDLETVKTKIDEIRGLIEKLRVQSINPNFYAVKDIQVETRQDPTTRRQQDTRALSRRIREPQQQQDLKFSVEISPKMIRYKRGKFYIEYNGQTTKTNITDLYLYKRGGSLYDRMDLDMTPLDEAIRQLKKAEILFSSRNAHPSLKRLTGETKDAPPVAAARKHLSIESLLNLASKDEEKTKISEYLNDDPQARKYFQERKGHIGNVGVFGWR